MVPRPVVLGLTLCDCVIVEERTKKISLIGTFTGVAADRFPALIRPFSLFSVLTDGQGVGTVDIVATRLDADEEVYTYRSEVRFPGPLTEVSFHLRIPQLVAPEPGDYQFTLLIDGEWVAQRRIRVYARGEET